MVRATIPKAKPRKDKRAKADQIRVVLNTPWGSAIVWADTKYYIGKILNIKQRRRLSLQYHELKHESVYVISGLLQVQLGWEKKGPIDAFVMRPGHSLYIPAKQVHRFSAPFGDVSLCEVSTPHDEVVRIEDDYGRA